MTHPLLHNLKSKMEAELRGNILPFWMKHTVDSENGGFYGAVTNDLKVLNEVGRSLVLCARFDEVLDGWQFAQNRPAAVPRPLAIVVLALCSSLLWINIAYANVDWLVLLGATLPAPIGIWFVMMKPQVAIGIALYWLLQRETRRWIVFAPVMVAIVLNYWLLGLPNFLGSSVLHPARADVFPYGLPIALVLMIQSLRQSSPSLAVPVSAFLSPYYSITSWISLAPLARSWRGLLIVLIVSWLVFLIWRQYL